MSILKRYKRYLARRRAARWYAALMCKYVGYYGDVTLPCSGTYKQLNRYSELTSVALVSGMPSLHEFIWAKRKPKYWQKLCLKMVQKRKNHEDIS